MTGAPVGLLMLYGFAAVLAGVLMMAATRRRELATATPFTQAPSLPVAPAAAIVPTYAPSVLPAATAYRPRHARPSTTGVVLLVLVSVSLLAVQGRRR